MTSVRDLGPRVHPTAVITPGAVIDPSVRIGPFAVIGPRVELDAGCHVESHAVVRGETRLGPGNRVGHHAVLGGMPQIRDVVAGEAGRLEVGQSNWFREHVTVHVGGAPGRATRIGDHNMLMAGSHVAHDCTVGSGVELANGVQLAGHVVVGDHAALGGLAAVHQFVRIGRLAFVGAGAMVPQDVPPFALASGDRARIYDLNTVGLKRRGFSAEVRGTLRRALHLVLRAPTLALGLAEARKVDPSCPEVEELLAFVASTRRGLCRPVGRSR